MQANFQITLTSIISIILFSLIFGLLLVLMLRSEKLLCRIKYELLLVCMTAPIVRLLMPMEIIPWTKNINVTHVLPEIAIFFNKEIVAVSGNNLSRWEIVFGILSIISLLNVVRIFLSYRAFAREVNGMPLVENPEIQKLVDRILAEKGKNVSIPVRRMDKELSPCVFGLCKPSILLPSEEFDEAVIESVLRHEIAHYLHKDLWIRLGWMLIKGICWWNPAVYILDTQLGKILEIRADENAVKGLDELGQNDYMQALVIISRFASKRKETRGFGVAIVEENGLTVRKRINLIEDRKHRKRISIVTGTFATSFCVLVLAVVMNCFIIEPISEVPQDDYVQTKMSSESNSFLVKNTEGTYDMYVDGVFRLVLEEDYGSGLPIYESLEEALQYEEIK